MMKTQQALLLPFFLLIVMNSMAQVYAITDHGAIADGKTINTKAIQQAVDACSKTGGRVVIPKGTFVTGTIYLKSNITLQLDSGAVLKGSGSFDQYPDNNVQYKNVFTHRADGTPYTNKALLFGEGIQNVSFTGKGTIDGSGDSPAFQLGNDDTPESRKRPCLLLLIDSKKISLDGLRLQNSAYWVQNYLGCEDLQIRNLSIYSQSNYNQDGIDIDARNVLIENCNIDVDDDGICFKSHDRYRPVENIIVRNCTIRSNCNAIKFGTSSLGAFRNVDISNCIIRKASADHIRNWQKNLQFIGQPITVISGIALEAVDGSHIDNIRIKDIDMQDVQTPVFIVLGNRGRMQPGESKPAPVGSIRNVQLKNIRAISQSKMSSSITAFPGAYVEDVSLENVNISTMGKGTTTEAQTMLKENAADYPENRMYGLVYPASGLFIRHAKNITLKNISLQVRNKDHRPAIILDDTEDVKIAALAAQAPEGKTAVIRVVNSKRIVLEKPVIRSTIKPFVELRSTAAEEIKATGFKPYKDWLAH